MTQVLAGAVGGLLAIAAGVLAQIYGTRRQRQDRMLSAAAEFLTQGALLADAAGRARDAIRAGQEHDPLAGVFDSYLEATGRSAFELTFLTNDAETLVLLRRVQQQANLIIYSSLPALTDDDGWRAMLLEYGHQRLQLQHAIRAELGRRTLTDDDIGHDEPPTGTELIARARTDPQEQ